MHACSSANCAAMTSALKRFGSRKDKRPCSSSRLFCTGVPVSISRRWHLDATLDSKTSTVTSQRRDICRLSACLEAWHFRQHKDMHVQPTPLSNIRAGNKVVYPESQLSSTAMFQSAAYHSDTERVGATLCPVENALAPCKFCWQSLSHVKTWHATARNQPCYSAGANLFNRTVRGADGFFNMCASSCQHRAHHQASPSTGAAKRTIYRTCVSKLPPLFNRQPASIPYGSACGTRPRTLRSGHCHAQRSMTANMPTCSLHGSLAFQAALSCSRL